MTTARTSSNTFCYDANELDKFLNRAIIATDLEPVAKVTTYSREFLFKVHSLSLKENLTGAVLEAAIESNRHDTFAECGLLESVLEHIEPGMHRDHRKHSSRYALGLLLRRQPALIPPLLIAAMKERQGKSATLVVSVSACVLFPRECTEERLKTDGKLKVLRTIVKSLKGTKITEILHNVSHFPFQSNKRKAKKR